MLASRLGRSMMRHPTGGGGGMLASSVVGSVARAARALSSASINEEFLGSNAGMKGVTSLPSGLQYKVISSGPADAPTPGLYDACDCHYEGKLLDGTIFDSSIARGSPARFAPNQVIKGWTEAMMLMREGDKWQLTIPPSLAYGARGGGPIPGNAVLQFELEILNVHEGGGRFGWIMDPFNFAVSAALATLLYVGGSYVGGGTGGSADSLATKELSERFLAENSSKEGVITLASGLQYKYEGRCCKDWPSGKKFDSSYDRGSPTTFAPNQVIKGWTEAMQLMVEGDKWEMYIPANLAYGYNGRVPGCLVFTMEIVQIKGGSKPKVRKE